MSAEIPYGNKENPDPNSDHSTVSNQVPQLGVPPRGSAQAEDWAPPEPLRSREAPRLLRPAVPHNQSAANDRQVHAPAEAPAADKPDSPVAYARPRSVPITPSGNITWEAVDTASGQLYLPGGADTNAEVAALLQSDARGRRMHAGGVGGEIYLPPEGTSQDVVIKDFVGIRQGSTKALGLRLADLDRIISQSDHSGGLNSLRLNVMLAEGLDAVPQDEQAWRIRGVRILGALVTDQSTTPDAKPNSWVMERVVPVASGAVHVPDRASERRYADTRGILLGKIFDMVTPPLAAYSDRKALYDKALIQAAGGLISGDNIPNYDDKADNLILEKMPHKKRGIILEQGSAVKIDAVVHKGFDY
jgi:hypothetical protein